MTHPLGFVLPSRTTLLNNAVAGLIVGVIAFPLSIALAVAVGVPPIAGLYTAAFAGFAASAFGGSRFNITGPTAALVPLLLDVTIRHGVQALPLVGLMAGGLLVAMGFLRFGRLVRYMPGLVIVGFTAGIAISIALSQVNMLLGLTGTDPLIAHTPQRVWDTITHLGTISGPSAAIGLLSIAFLFWYQRSRRRIPGPLIVVVVATIAAQALNLNAATVASVYGDLPRSIPTPSFDFFDVWLAFELLPSAAAIAVLAGVESLLSAVVADGMANVEVRHDSDRELIGQGIANLVAPLMGGIPATAAIARTAAGVQNGATSRLTGMFHAVTIMALTLLFAGLASDIPLAALAAILVVVAYNIADVPEFAKLLRAAPRADLSVLVGTAAVTVIFDLVFAIALGVLISVVLLLRQLVRIPVTAELRAEERREVAERQPVLPLEILARTRPDVTIFNAQGVISFHSAAEFEYGLSGQDDRPLILRLRDVHHIDSSGLITLQGIIEHRLRTGRRIVLTDVHPDVEQSLRRFGLLQLLGEQGIYPTAEEALHAIPRTENAAIAMSNGSAEWHSSPIRTLSLWTGFLAQR